MSLEIVGGRLIDPAAGIDQVIDLFIAEGRVAGIEHAPAGFVAERTLDASGQIVIPGLIDLAARLREPGQEHKATIASETRAAAAAGITTLCCYPDTEPVAQSPAEVKLIQQRADAAGFCRVFTIGALTQGLKGKALSEMAALKQAGCVGVTNALYPLDSLLILRRAMEYAASQDLTVFLHPLDASLCDGGCAHEGAVATRLGLPGIPAAAETAAVSCYLALIEHTGVRAHFCRLSTARAVHMIRRAQYDGLPISADVCAHQLFLTEMDISDFNALCHTMPPLRTQRDRQALRQGVAEGAIGALCSDHQPHELDAKRAPFPATESGISALETLLPLTLRVAQEGAFSLPQAIAAVTSAPASILGLALGSLQMGYPADVCIFDPEATWTLTPNHMLSQGKNTPFIGWEFAGRISHTLLQGRIVYDAAAVV